MPIVFIIAAAASMIGGAIGNAIASSDKAKAAQLLQDATDEFGKINIPKLKRLAAEQLAPSALNQVKSDPAATDAQYQTLGQMKEIQDAGGLTTADMAAQERALEGVERGQNAQRASLARDFEARGQLGGGAQMAIGLNQQQQGAENAHQIGMDTAGRASTRYYNSILDRGRFAGDLRQQQYGEDARKAEAADAIARYNADMRHRTALDNNAVDQANFDNDFRTRSEIARLKTGQAGQSQANSQAAQQSAYNMSSGIANTAIGAAQYAGASGGTTGTATGSMKQASTAQRQVPGQENYDSYFSGTAAGDPISKPTPYSQYDEYGRPKYPRPYGSDSSNGTGY